MISLVLVDDHQIVIDGLKALLRDQEDIRIIGEANNGQELIDNCIELHPDVILMDIGMPVMDGVEACRAIKETHPFVKILILTTYADKKKIREILKLDIDGYLLKNSGKEVIIDAIHTIHNNETYYDKRVTDSLIQSFSRKKEDTIRDVSLTKREKEIIRLIVEGMSTTEIGETLFLSKLTVETHRKNIYIKLGVNKVASLVRYALEEGLVK